MNSNNSIQTNTYIPSQCAGTPRAIQQLDSELTVLVATDPVAGNPLFAVDEVDWQSLPNDEDDAELRAWLEVCKPDWQESGERDKMSG